MYTLLQPGTITVLLPYLILKMFEVEVAIRLSIQLFSALLLLVSGLLLFLWSIYTFSKFSDGTISPFDPSKKLVTSGPYQYSRNPMYVAILFTLFGEALLFSSCYLFLYSLIICLLFYLFIVLHEEPRQSKLFGEDYVRYTQRVNRWI